MEIISSDLSEDAHQMMNKSTLSGGASTVMEYCGRCGKPKQYIGDYWGQDPPPWCTCPPIEQWSSGQFKRQGWECPKCNRVYAPSVDECEHCRPPVEPTSDAVYVYPPVHLSELGLRDDKND